MMTETLTNESLAGICKSNFELAHYAINLWRYYIQSGREADLADVLREVRKHPTPAYVEELKEIDEISMKKEERPQERPQEYVR